MTNEKQRIWDLPTRVFHWSLVACISYSWWSAEYGDLIWHKRSGYVILSLIIFRILWGIWGSSTSRFTHFIRGPKKVIGYVKGLPTRNTPLGNNHSEHPIGHNPLGGWSVIAFLLLILGQIILGLFAEDVDGLDSGPFSYLVSYDVGRWAAKTHEDVFNFLLALIILHIAAVFFYLFYKKTNLIKPMFTGNIASPAVFKTVTHTPLWIAVITLFAASVFVWWLVT